MGDSSCICRAKTNWPSALGCIFCYLISFGACLPRQHFISWLLVYGIEGLVRNGQYIFYTNSCIFIADEWHIWSYVASTAACNAVKTILTRTSKHLRWKSKAAELTWSMCLCRHNCHIFNLWREKIIIMLNFCWRLQSIFVRFFFQN